MCCECAGYRRDPLLVGMGAGLFLFGVKCIKAWRSLRGYRPNRLRESRVIEEPRNDMPVQVWREIAEAGQVYFFRAQRQPQCRLQREYRIHENFSVGGAQIGHFLYVCVPDNAAKTGICCAIGTVHSHHAPFIAANDEFAAVAIA